MNRPKDMRALLPVEQIILDVERERNARYRRGAFVVFAVMGWLFFAAAVAVSIWR